MGTESSGGVLRHPIIRVEGQAVTVQLAVVK
jgi:hypothetical protein